MAWKKTLEFDSSFHYHSQSYIYFYFTLVEIKQQRSLKENGNRKDTSTGNQEKIAEIPWTHSEKEGLENLPLMGHIEG